MLQAKYSELKGRRVGVMALRANPQHGRRQRKHTEIDSSSESAFGAHASDLLQAVARFQQCERELERDLRSVTHASKVLLSLIHI